MNQFLHQMNTSMDGQFTALADTLTMLNQSQTAAQQNQQRTLKLAESLVEDAKRIQQSSRDFAAMLDDDAQALARAKQEELLSLLQDVVTQQTAVARGLAGMQSEMLATLREVEGIVRREHSGAASAQRMAELTDALTRMRLAADGLSARLDAAARDASQKAKAQKTAGH